MGYLKGHFQSLKGLRQQIKNETDHLRAVEWIRACIVIHTLIHEIEYGNEDSDADWEEEILAAGLSSDESSSSDDNRVAAEVRRESAGQRKRRKVKESLFRSEIFE